MSSIPILFADDALLVVDKPAGVLVVPAPTHRGPTVVDLVSDQLGERVHAVHRLDEDTTGVLVLARHEKSKAWLEDVFKEHRATRTYLALVEHTPSPPAGRIESLLREMPSGIVQSVTKPPGELAVTHYRTLGRRGKQTLVECQPQTGRRNQIRVHMRDLGCPLCGDRKYGWRARGVNFGRMMLHAERIVVPRADGRPQVDVMRVAQEIPLRRDRA
jgi:23S rRNA pseudouridine1911/1915/1917 synthase